MRVGAELARQRSLIAAAIFVAVVVSRLPFATTHLWAWDSVLYARALEQGFHVDADPAASRPHPPGYLWYVAAASLARVVLADSNAALVLVSILASAATAALLYLIAVRHVRRSIALLIALAYATSPVTWMYSELAYPYTVLALVSLALGALFIEGRSPVLSSLAFGVLSGARQDVLLLLAPLWLWSLPARSPRGILAHGGVVAVGALTWIVPSVLLSGGAGPYAAALLQQGEHVATTYSVPLRGLPALAYNAGFTLEAIAWGLGLLAIPLALRLVNAARMAWSSRQIARPDRLTAGLAVWALPALAFYTVVHIGEWGYVLSVVPALLLSSAVVLDRMVPARPSPRWALAAMGTVVLPAAIFLFGGGVYGAVVGNAEFSAAALARHDARLDAEIAYVRERFPSSSTVILTREDNLLVRYYLPEFRAWYWDPDPYRAEAKRRRAVRPMYLVVLTPGLQPLLQGDVRRVEIAPGISVSYIPVDAGNTLELQGERYVVRDTSRGPAGQ